MWAEKFAAIAAATKEKDQLNTKKLSDISDKMKAYRLAADNHVNNIIKPIFKEIINTLNKNKKDWGFIAITEAPSGGMPPAAFLKVSNGKRDQYEKACSIAVIYSSGNSFTLETTSPGFSGSAPILMDELDKKRIESILEELLAKTF